MFSYTLRRFASMLPALLGVSLLVFLMIHLAPGDPARLLLGKRATPELVTKIRTDLGLDKPIYVQYVLYLKRIVLHGDLGTSTHSRRKITTELGERFPATLELTFAAMILAIVGGILLGVLAATHRGRALDFLGMFSSLAGVSMPIFWLGLVLILIFAYGLGLFPVSGRLSPQYDISLEKLTDIAFLNNFYTLRTVATGNWTAFWDYLRHLVLPAVTLATVPLAVIARITRSSMLEVLHQDYIRTAQAKGLSRRKVVFKHALKNSLIPVVTVIGLEFGYLLGGAVLTETVFAWPGVGRWIVEAVSKRDFPVIQGGVLFIATLFMLVNLLVDMLYTYLDPRIRLG